DTGRVPTLGDMAYAEVRVAMALGDLMGHVLGELTHALLDFPPTAAHEHLPAQAAILQAADPERTSRAVFKQKANLLKAYIFVRKDANARIRAALATVHALGDI